MNGNDNCLGGGSSLLRHEPFDGVVSVTGGSALCETGLIQVSFDWESTDLSIFSLLDLPDVAVWVGVVSQ